MAKFDKAKQIKKTKVRKWWFVRVGKYTVYFWAIPLLPFALLVDGIKEYNYKRRVWDEKIATKVLDKVLPQVLEWVEDDKAYYYCMEWGISSLWRKAPRRYRKWADKFAFDLQRYIRDGYENADYIKEIEVDGCFETWVKFTEK